MHKGIITAVNIPTPYITAAWTAASKPIKTKSLIFHLLLIFYSSYKFVYRAWSDSVWILHARYDFGGEGFVG